MCRLVCHGVTVMVTAEYSKRTLCKWNEPIQINYGKILKGMITYAFDGVGRTQNSLYPSTIVSVIQELCSSIQLRRSQK